jgi:hypothetical protein
LIGFPIADHAASDPDQAYGKFIISERNVHYVHDNKPPPVALECFVGTDVLPPPAAASAYSPPAKTVQQFEAKSTKRVLY